MITLQPYQLAELLEKAAEAGANKVLQKLGMNKPTLKKAEAYRLYGRQTVDRWIKEQLITPIKDRENTGTVRLSRAELEKASLTSNRMSYFKSLPEEE